MSKHKPTNKELKEMLALYLRGLKPRKILEKFPDVEMTSKDLSTWFCKQKAKENKDKINEKVMDNLVNDIVEEQTQANRELIKASKRVIEVINEYLEKGQYYDHTCFNFGKLIKTRSNTLNTMAFNMVVKSLAEAQKVQRLALGMDEEEKEELERPVINFNFGEVEEQGVNGG